jgi:hypothetical protein
MQQHGQQCLELGASTLVAHCYPIFHRAKSLWIFIAIRAGT